MIQKPLPIDGIAAPLVSWYTAHERAFPWRETPTPYRVWVSEIMLQQTRIEAALPYFDRFMATLPTVEALAAVEDDVLMKLWEGLGYYSRARHLKQAAIKVMAEYGGELPASFEELLTLPGIGEYTAGAIASIAFGERVAAVDGNVLRVMARLLDDGQDVMQPRHRKTLSALVHTLVPQSAPGAFNQGLMELGETVCLPNAMPHCEVCPLAAYCAVAGTKRAAELPVRAAAKPRKIEKRLVFVVTADRRVLLHKRAENGLLGGLWELPNRLLDGTVEQTTTAFCRELSLNVSTEKPLPDGKHIFSHVEWHLQGRWLKTTLVALSPDYRFVTKDELDGYALPTAFRTYTARLPAILDDREDVI